MTDTHQPKKSTKKWIYIGIGLAILIIIVVGGLFLWNKLKSSDKSDSTDQEEEDINEEELPIEIKQYRKKVWIDPKTGLCNYKFPSNLPTNISVARAKDELLEAFYQSQGKNWDKKKIGKVLEKNAQRINLADKKGNEDDPLFETKFLESIAKKYRQNIFSSLPKQEKFEEIVNETINNLHLLRASFDLKYKNNKKIDWLASLWKYKNLRVKDKTKTQQEKDFAKMTNYLEKEYNPFVRLHINKFPTLTSLKELNQWTHILIKKMTIAGIIVHTRFHLGQRMSKKVLSPARGGWERKIHTNLKNEKFDLKPVFSIFKP